MSPPSSHSPSSVLPGHEGVAGQSWGGSSLPSCRGCRSDDRETRTRHQGGRPGTSESHKLAMTVHRDPGWHDFLRSARNMETGGWNKPLEIHFLVGLGEGFCFCFTNNDMRYEVSLLPRQLMIFSPFDRPGREANALLESAKAASEVRNSSRNLEKLDLPELFDVSLTIFRL